jgi:leucyl aminopeptidase (aminopeptidase T)
MHEAFQDIRVLPELIQGAQNAVNVCLRIQPEEHTVIITDEETIEIAAALAHEIHTVGSSLDVYILEDFSQRPLVDMPRPILEDLEHAQVSIFAAQAQRGELGSRIQMTEVINRKKIRHAHMVNINNQIMTEGMRADFLAVDDLSTRVVNRARQAKQIRATSKAGTDIRVELSEQLRWVKTSGIISRDKWGNLPGGEVFTAPFNVNGHFVVDGVVGDYLCQKYGDLKNNPLDITITENRISDVSCENDELLGEFLSYTSTDENSNRAGEFAIGTNLALTGVIGHILQDEKLPGIHIAFGNPYGEHTGQTWNSTTHIDCVGRDFDIWMDEEKIMDNGKFLI